MISVNFKQQLIKDFTKSLLVQKSEKAKKLIKNVDGNTLEQANIILEAGIAYAIASQTIVFDGKQAQIFKDATQNYTDTLDYKLPFECVFLQFTQPVDLEIRNNYNEQCRDVEALILAQSDNGAGLFRNFAFAIYRSPIGNGYLPLFIQWASDGTELHFDDNEPEEMRQAIKAIERLAISCIGFINCLNVDLEKIEGASEAINRKREQKGKSRLEPYYICKIKGGEHDSVGATGTGSKHDHIYDVRGHFRKLTSGKTIWVRPHLRGIHSGGLYIPKTYVVDRGNQ